MSPRREMVLLLRSRIPALAAIAGAVVVGALLELAPPLVMRQIVDSHLVPGRAEGLAGLALAYLAAVAGANASGFVAAYITALAAQGALNELRVRLYRHVQDLPLSFHDRTPLGDVISRCTADVETLDTLFTSGVARLLADLVRLVAVSAAMVALSPALAMVSALVVPPLVWVTSAFRKRIRDAERGNRLAIGMANTHLQETLGGVEVIRAFHRERAFVQRFRRVLARTVAAYNEATRYSALYSPIMQILMAAMVALLLASGAHATAAGVTLSLGTLTAFVLLFARFFEPITALGEEWQTIQSAAAGAERIFEILALPVERRERDTPGGASALSRSAGDSSRPAGRAPAGGILMREVTFGYTDGQPVLEDLTLQVRPREHVALIGRTGAGKSTLLNLAAGLYAPWRGRILANGRDPHALQDSERKYVVGVVPQTSQLFSGTVLDNLTLNDPAVPLDLVKRAASITGAEALVSSLPDGYRTVLRSSTGSGVQLSAGQRQLLALTRALVWQPSVLLFDEATSAIDSASEATFRAALRQDTVRERAILTIAHRLATALEADRVIVLDAGRVIEQGPPEDLRRAGGRFAAWLELEAAGWDWRESSYLETRGGRDGTGLLHPARCLRPGAPRRRGPAPGAPACGARRGGHGRR